ncbi:MAG TPA: hypothetical protein VKX39_15155 [Bryobacteraceae bacterium]|jgi:hypothetical protein|nr:hypothetical protein [Bryobacteraceae bacterium]
MALLTDGSPNTPEDLTAYESAILNVAATEAIDLGVKLSLATEEISEDVLDILLDHTRGYDPQSMVRRQIGVADVVVSPQMKRWHALHTLAMVYRDAFNNQLNDRYLPKWQEYRKLSADARSQTAIFGIGLVNTPIPEAGVPALSMTAAAGAATAIYYIAITWVAANGEEGAPSPVTTFETGAGMTLVVAGVNPPAVATGFNVYVGLSSTSLALQTASPVPAGQSFVMPATGLFAGRAPGDGQKPDVYVIGGPTLRRG